MTLADQIAQLKLEGPYLRGLWSRTNKRQREQIRKAFIAENRELLAVLGLELIRHIPPTPDESGQELIT